MSTPLERWLEGLRRGKQDLCLDMKRLAIGTDKNAISPLCDGVQWLSNTSSRVEDADDWVLVPRCLAYHLIVTGAQWTMEGNQAWIREVTASPEPPVVCHVFHASASKALIGLAGRCTKEAFLAKGWRPSASIDEISVVLDAGYTKVTEMGERNHAMLWKT